MEDRPQPEEPPIETGRGLSNRQQASPRGLARTNWSLDEPPNRRLGLAYCEAVAFGRSLTSIEQDPGLPPRDLFMLWTMRDPELAAAFTRALAVSAYSLEDEALHLLRAKVESAKSMVELRAADLLVQQLRWSATKRNPQVFSDKAAVSVVVPIQINTSLDMGTAGAASATKEFPNIYELQAEPKASEAPAEDAPSMREAPGGVRDTINTPKPERVRTRPHKKPGKRKLTLTPRTAMTFEQRAASVAARVAAAKRKAPDGSDT